MLLLAFSATTVRAQSDFSITRMEQAATYSEQMGGVAVLIYQNGRIIFEDYHNGADTSVVTHIQSATKAFWAMATAAAIESGLIDSFDERVALTLTEWQDAAQHPFKNRILLRHLLALSGGLSQDIEQIQGLDAQADDLYAYAIDSLRIQFLPGNRFQYGPSNYYAYGAFLERKLKRAGIDQNPLAYLDSVIFSPIGLQYDSWAHDPSGNPHIPNGCYITPREWVKFGQLLLQKGKWADTQLVDSNLVKQLFVADGPNPGHGKFLWLNHPDGQGAFPGQTPPAGSSGGFMYHDGYTDLIGALGGGRNRMYIIPAQNAVVLRQSIEDRGDFQDDTFLRFLLDEVTQSANKTSTAVDIIYPNPALDRLHIQTATPVRRLRIVNLRGQVVHMTDAFPPKTIALTGLPAGLYLLQLEHDQEVRTYPFVKQ